MRKNIIPAEIPKNVALSFLIFVAVCLVVAAYPPTLDDGTANGLEKFLPKASDLATSPTAQKILEGIAKENGQPRADTPAGIETGQTAAPDQDSETVQGDKLAIPSLGTELPLVIAKTADAAKIHDLLDFGVVLYPGSAAFGSSGQTVVLGHSAPANWPKIRYERAFSRINELKKGDEVIVSYLGKTYNYRVVRAQIIEKGNGFSGEALAGNSLVLVTCWPPGHDQKRIAVEASLERSGD